MTSCANCGKVEKCSRASAWKDNCDDYTRKTNFQRITQSEETLAEFISNITCECWGCKRVYSASCPHHKNGLTDFCDGENALEWLKQENDTE